MTAQQLFIAKYKDDVINATSGTGIFPSVKMAQMALETGWGKSKVGNNMFGIKAKGEKSPFWQGKEVASSTTEFINGKPGTYSEPFREYASIADSIRDHSYFLLTNNRYKKAGVFSAISPMEQAKALQAAGYATDPNYATKLVGIIDTYNLYELDKKKSQ